MHYVVHGCNVPALFVLADSSFAPVKLLSNRKLLNDLQSQFVDGLFTEVRSQLENALHISDIQN
jgi:hypothetical protein